MISTTARYALRAVVFLANHQEGYCNRAEISEATLVPHDYLLKVLNELDSAGIVESRRGPGGGYRLTDAPDRLTTLRVIEAVDEIPRIRECPLGLTDHERLCPLHALLDRAARSVEETFQKTTIASLINGRKRSQTCDFPNHSKP